MSRILTVDDDLYILELYRGVLEEAGHALRTAEDAAGALVVYQEFHPELVILGFDIPGGGGMKVYDRLRKILMVDIPVIFMTGTEEGSGPVLLDPRVRVMHKPIDQALLLGNISRLLAG
ncbi:MAG: hypothetical protein A2X31_03810 [Elusimicrobia bacterium GWB2_63_22]|jgi:DNA-binding response OmpR family regulator|nr:MAG: hypothetical protein A2X31_03810 [Elusimicrobia bacterium GWB2_63_22]HBB67624.1 hypothetical protein [Elusimicrobiota bacterium]